MAIAFRRPGWSDAWQGGAVLAALGLAGCNRVQSALAPAGTEAALVAQMTWWMIAGGAAIWLAVIGAAVYAAHINPERHDLRFARRLILWAGAIVPAFVLGGLSAYGLAVMPSMRAPGDGLRIHVSGEQWWWRVTYRPDGAAVASANEIRLPAGERVELVLESPDVIHSLWIPSIAGKIDMIPGRTNRLVVEATKAGQYRGVCAEFCGTSHALMAFSVVVMPRQEFQAWLEREAEPAVRRDIAGEPGLARFLEAGCGACHAIRGTPADGAVGPDLTHVGGRLTLGAGILPNDADTLVRWIAATPSIKPGVRMPHFGMLPPESLRAIADYLESLE